jgi:hypothetical protein
MIQPISMDDMFANKKSRAREQLFTPITFAKKNFLLIHAKKNTNVRDSARDT